MAPSDQQHRARELESQLRTELKKSALMREIGSALSSGMGLDELLTLIMTNVTELMGADRSTLYLLADDGQTLWSKILQGDNFMEIRLAVGEGVAGWAAQLGAIVNIPDAYTDTRFQPAVDTKSGYRTRTILCAPMRNNQGDIIGVLQVLNKQNGNAFTLEDEELLVALSSLAATAVENTKLFRSVLEAKEKVQRKSDELEVLYQIEKLMNRDLDLDTLLAEVLRQAMAAVGAESGVIGLRDPETNAIEYPTAAGPKTEGLEQHVPSTGQGVVSWVVAHDEPLIINDPASDERFVRQGELPKNLACAPLRGSEVLGAIALMDKIEQRESDAPVGFQDSDVKLMELIAGQAAKAIQLSRARSERAKQERLSSIGRMLASVLHDLKTPMTIISGYAQLMAQIDELEQREAFVEQILRQFDFMSGMTREVLAFARGETELLVRRVFLHKFMDEVSTQLKHAMAGRNVDLRVEAKYNGTAYFDEQKVMRILHNLARNAADAMTNGGELTVTSSLENEGQEGQEVLLIEVADNGPGIPEELEGRLFEMFATGRQGGTGLGLAIVKKIVDEHMGSITYTTQRGQGTTFHVRLPRKVLKSAADPLEQTMH